jgi:pimeloyl-ACP methyl ester carboxylesterase
MTTTRRKGVAGAPGFVFVCLLAQPAASAVIPPEAPEVAVLSRGTPAGTITATEAGSETPAPKTVDGETSDWIGVPTRLGGTAIYSKGEYVYQDHLFDAYGADDGKDVDRLALLAPTEAEPRAYRLDPGVQYAQGELDAPEVGPFTGDESYGDAPHQDRADLAEVRVAADATTVYILARTTTMTSDQPTALVVLADTAAGGSERSVPFASGLRTTAAERVFLLAGGQCLGSDLVAPPAAVSGCGTVANAAGFVNAIEASLPRSLVEDPSTGTLRIALAAGRYDGTGGFTALGPGVNVANVAFRFDEPVRIHFEKQQALALQAGSIDDFFTTVDLAGLAAGRTDTFVARRGYHDRIFLSTSTPAILEERGDRGLFQHYGVYLPTSYAPGSPAPLQFWLHFRGGLAHTVAAVVPRAFQQFGEEADTIVVSPSGRGTSRWYVGKAHVDFNEVWDDVHASFAIDDDQVYVTGHSMGGWGTYLMTVLYPDRFAAGMPVAGPVTQGAWTGVDFEGCDDFTYHDDGDTYSPCYEGVNGGQPREQHTRRMLENLRNVPLAVFQGAIDELVFVSGVTRQVEEMARLALETGPGYAYRYYLFPTYEHYSHPIVDEWVEGVAYLHSFERNPDPPRVTYRRDMPFERTVEAVQSDGVPLDFTFDHAYWMSELTPADPIAGVARFDGRSLALEDPTALMVPEAGGPSAPGQTGPFVMTGLARQDLPLLGTATTNGFQATLAGATRVRLDLGRMQIDSAARVDGAVDTGLAATLELRGGWTAPPSVTANGTPVAATLVSGVLSIPLDPGASQLVIVP